MNALMIGRIMQTSQSSTYIGNIHRYYIRKEKSQEVSEKKGSY